MVVIAVVRTRETMSDKRGEERRKDKAMKKKKNGKIRRSIRGRMVMKMIMKPR